MQIKLVVVVVVKPCGEKIVHLGLKALWHSNSTWAAEQY